MNTSSSHHCAWIGRDCAASDHAVAQRLRRLDVELNVAVLAGGRTDTSRCSCRESDAEIDPEASVFAIRSLYQRRVAAAVCSTIAWMPRLSTFHGIVIYMYRPDHPPAHFHAQYGEHIAQIELGTLRVLSGLLPPRALRLVREWARLHTEELASNWALAQALEPLVPIEPLP